MSSPLEFLATLNGSLVSPLESLLFPIIGGLVIITALWALTMGPLRGRPDLIAPALFRSFAIAGLIFASPYVGTLLLSGWSIAYSTGYNAAKQSLDDILERGNTYFSTMGLIAGGVGAQAVKVAALKVEQAAREAAIKRITAEVYEEVNTQAAKQGWSSTKIGQELHERLLRRLTPEEIEAATQKELASGKSLGNRMDKALNYANWVGIPLMGMLWLFYVLGLATGLTVILLKLAWPIALAMLALSPRSGSFFMARWFNMAISALATALLVPMIVGLAAQIFIGVPVEEVINRWKELADTTGGGGFLEWLKDAFSLVAISLWSALLILGGLFMLFIVGGIAATAVPTVIGQVLVSTGLFETVLAGRAAVGLLPAVRGGMGRSGPQTGAPTQPQPPSEPPGGGMYGGGGGSTPPPGGRLPPASTPPVLPQGGAPPALTTGQKPTNPGRGGSGMAVTPETELVRNPRPHTNETGSGRGGKA